MQHSKKITIVYIITKLELGGAQKVCLSLFQGIHSENVNTYLISGNEGTLTHSLRSKKNIALLDTFKNNLSLTNAVQEIRNFFTIVKKLRAIKKEHGLVVVHTHSSKAGIIGRWAAFFAGIKKRVHTIHGYALHPHLSYITWIFFYLVELLTSFITTHFICVSSEDVKTGIKLFPGFAKKHSIIRAAIEWNQFLPLEEKQYSPSKKIFTFGTIACFKPQKNLFDLLAAFKNVHTLYPHSTLEIIGDGQLRPAIESWITHHKLTGSVILHGWQESVAPIMKQWDCFVLSSLWEGLPCAIVEARLLKLPVISYDTGGIKDIIFHGQNGLLIPQKDVERLTHSMERIINDKDLYTAFTTYDDNLDDFDHHTMIQNHQDLYFRL